jgi:hypothetical protein
MQISREDLAKRYSSFSDAELLDIDPNGLTDLARQCYDREVERRHLPEREDSNDAEVELDEHEVLPDIGPHDGEAPDWLDTAATACSFQVGSGRRYAEDAERACEILRDAGIPSQVLSEHEDDDSPDLLKVMVPGALSLKAESILDRDLFNEQMEETWRAHFDELSTEELRAVHVDDLCAGLLDRAKRLKRAYEEALARRRSATNAS